VSKIYIVSLIELPDSFHDMYELHYASSYKKCIEFIERALSDENSGVENDSIITICECELDEYFGEMKFYEEKPAIEYLGKQ
jgi:hypothetical protein